MLITAFINVTLDFSLKFILIVYVGHLGFIIGPFVFFRYLVVFMMAWIIIRPSMDNKSCIRPNPT